MKDAIRYESEANEIQDCINQLEKQLWKVYDKAKALNRENDNGYICRKFSDLTGYEASVDEVEYQDIENISDWLLIDSDNGTMSIGQYLHELEDERDMNLALSMALEEEQMQRELNAWIEKGGY